MDAAYVFRVRFRLDPEAVRVDPAEFDTVAERPAPPPGEDGWRLFESALWRGEASDEAHLRRLLEGWLSVPVVGVSFSELRTDEAYLDALRAEIRDCDAFDDSPRDVLHAHLGSSIRVG
jgi:hypothetical protein